MSKTLTIAHNQWASRPEDQRFQTLDALFEHCNSRRSLSREVVKDITDLHSEVCTEEDGSQFLQIGNGNRLTPTNWSFSQFAGLVGAPAAFLRKLTPGTTSTVLNERIKAVKASGEKSQIKLLRVLGDDGDTMQALTSTTYGRIWDADCVAGVQKIVERTNGAFYNPKAYAGGRFGGEPVPSGLYASDRDVFMFMIDGGSMFDIGPRAKLNRGFIAFNSEVGSKTFGLMTFLFNQVCGNHFIYGAQDISTLLIRHSAGGPARFIDQALPTLIEYTKSTPDLEPIIRAQSLKLADIKPSGFIHGESKDEWAKCFARENGFTVAEIREAFDFAHREEQRCETLWDLIQGFTASAREIPHVDTRLDLEKRSSALINFTN